jgi:DNA-binding response OmpR family regulator
LGAAVQAFHPSFAGARVSHVLRAAPELRDIPVIMLSALAGEESRVDGLQAGADDYLVKPFSARELLARVGSNLKLVQLRRESRTVGRRTKQLTRTPLSQPDAYRMIERRNEAFGIETKIGNHSFRATGITAYLKNGGTLEKAASMANHASTRTTQLYDRRSDEVTLDEVERGEFEDPKRCLLVELSFAGQFL